MVEPESPMPPWKVEFTRVSLSSITSEIKRLCILD